MVQLYTCEQVANHFHVKKETVWAWIRRGRLKACFIGKSYRIREDDIVAFEQQYRKQPNEMVTNEEKQS